MRCGCRASWCALLVLAALILYRQYGQEISSLVRHCVSNQKQAKEDYDTIVTCEHDVEREKHRVLEISRCYRSCILLCTKKGLRGSKDEMRLACTSCIIQCEALADVRETDLAALG